MSRIILTDIHGSYKTLLALVAKLPKGVPLTFAGDLIDRGPNSRAVVDFVKNGGHDVVVGNHETMMLNDLKFREDGTYFVDYYHSDWLRNGGSQTLDSYYDENYNIDVLALKEHAEWFKTLPYFKHYENEVNDDGQSLLVSHSTAAEVWGEFATESRRFKNAVTWDRTDFPKNIPGVFNIFGHTPQKDGPTIKKHFANIDTGCYMRRAGFRKLTALQWPEMTIYEQENCEE